MLSPQTLSDRQLRWFGISLSSLIMVLGLLISWRSQITFIAIIAAVISVVLSAVFYLIPSSRRPIHRGFSTCVYPIQYVVTVVLLALVYFGLLTPIGVFLRLRGYDPLNRRRETDPSADSPVSHWVKREPSPPNERYFKTY